MKHSEALRGREERCKQTGLGDARVVVERGFAVVTDGAASSRPSVSGDEDRPDHSERTVELEKKPSRKSAGLQQLAPR